MTQFHFKIIIDDCLSQISQKDELKSLLNNKIFGIVNYFEDNKWNENKFQNYIWDRIVYAALSANERSSLVDSNHSALIKAAKNLRLTDSDEVGSGSEIAEILLYGLMNDHFKALPVVPKIFYKQNVNDNVKGADSVHIVINDKGDDFSLWFGEAKFFNSLDDSRIPSVIKSVFDTLGTEKIKKENRIITNVSDIRSLGINPELSQNIIDTLNNLNSIDEIKSKIHIPIMILHQCSITSACSEMSDQYLNDILEFQIGRAESYFLKQLAKSSSISKYESITFHLILFPVPDKSKIVQLFMDNAKFYKSKGN